MAETTVCPACGGTGGHEPTDYECPTCAGGGMVKTTIPIGTRVRVRPTVPQAAKWRERFGEVTEVVPPGHRPKRACWGGADTSREVRYVVESKGCKNLLRRAGQMDLVDG